MHVIEITRNSLGDAPRACAASFVVPARARVIDAPRSMSRSAWLQPNKPLQQSAELLTARFARSYLIRLQLNGGVMPPTSACSDSPVPFDMTHIRT